MILNAPLEAVAPGRKPRASGDDPFPAGTDFGATV